MRPIRGLSAPLVFILSAAAAMAEPMPLPQPTGPILLTVSGDIAVTNAGETAAFDREMLAEIGTASFVTSTIWTEGRNEFSGTPLRALLDRLGVTEGTVEAVALNDYSAEIPIDEVTEDAPILATLVDGHPMSVRDQGPVWIVYPYLQEERYRNTQTYVRSVWQLTRLVVRKDRKD